MWKMVNKMTCDCDECDQDYVARHDIMRLISRNEIWRHLSSLILLILSIFSISIPPSPGRLFSYISSTYSSPFHLASYTLHSNRLSKRFSDKGYNLVSYMLSFYQMIVYLWVGIDMVEGVVHTHLRTITVQQPIVIVFVAIALVAVVGGFIFISNYFMPNIHQVCQSRLGPLHCYKVQYHKVFWPTWRPSSPRPKTFLTKRKLLSKTYTFPI
jgi:hypothetical protein